MKARFVTAASLVALLLQARAARADTSPQPAIQLAIDGGVATRRLAWKDDLFGTLRDYSLAAAPVAGGELALYPGAIFTTGPASWIGLAARVEALVGVDSRRSEHTASLPTKAGAFTASLRLRAPLPFGAAWVDAGFAGRTFFIDASGYTDPDIPSVRYLGPHFGLGAELPLPLRLSVAPRAGASVWTTSGDLSSPTWFPNTRAWGLDLAVRVRFRLPLGFAPYLDFSWTRDVLALHPQPGATRVAGGAADDRFAARLGVEWTIGSPARPFEAITR